MHITFKDFKRYSIFTLIFVWLVLFSHLFYLYMQSKSKEIPVKWWILLEWAVVSNVVNPFPYIANNYHSKYVQSLLFRGCLNDLGKNDLCEISTKDRKTFIVKVLDDNYWSDGRKITADDVYFTYNQVIKNNSFKLKNPISNTIEKVEKINSNEVKITFKDITVNNWSFFKNPILPKHILDWMIKELYIKEFMKNLVNSTCVKIDPVSDFKTKIVLDFTNCKDYYISKYQFNIVKNVQQLKKYLTGSVEVDIYNGYDNISPEKFKKFEILLSTRYAIFWNVLKQKDPFIKTYLSSVILSWLKNDIVLSDYIAFNWYGLFTLPKVNLDNKTFKQKILKNYEDELKEQYKNKIITITGDIIPYTPNKKNFFAPSINEKLIVNWLLSTGYNKVAVQANSGIVYVLKTYKSYSKQFKYVISEKFKNVKAWKNTYKIYGFVDNKPVLVDTFTLYYKKIVYPKFDVKIPDFKVVYLNTLIDGLIGDNVVEILKNTYPWKVIPYKVSITEYKEILKSKDYDLAVWSINFDWKDISYIFLSDNPLENPSNFVNPNFASLIKQNLLSTKDLKKTIFPELNKIYQQNIPVIILWNKKMWLYVQKKYNIPDLDYSYFTNRKEMLKHIILSYIKKPNSWISAKWFVNYLLENIKKQ